MFGPASGSLPGPGTALQLGPAGAHPGRLMVVSHHAAYTHDFVSLSDDDGTVRALFVVVSCVRHAAAAAAAAGSGGGSGAATACGRRRRRRRRRRCTYRRLPCCGLQRGLYSTFGSTPPPTSNCQPPTLALLRLPRPDLAHPQPDVRCHGRGRADPAGQRLGVPQHAAPKGAVCYGLVPNGTGTGTGTGTACHSTCIPLEVYYFLSTYISHHVHLLAAAWCTYHTDPPRVPSCTSPGPSAAPSPSATTAGTRSGPSGSTRRWSAPCARPAASPSTA
jgi:hypothetical protein